MLVEGRSTLAHCRKLLARGKSAKAIDLLSVLIQSEPSEDVSLLLAKAQIMNGAFDDARKTLESLVYEKPSQKSFELLIRVCRALGDEEAATFYQKAAAAPDSVFQPITDFEEWQHTDEISIETSQISAPDLRSALYQYLEERENEDNLDHDDRYYVDENTENDERRFVKKDIDDSTNAKKRVEPISSDSIPDYIEDEQSQERITQVLAKDVVLALVPDSKDEPQKSGLNAHPTGPILEDERPMSFHSIENVHPTGPMPMISDSSSLDSSEDVLSTDLRHRTGPMWPDELEQEFCPTQGIREEHELESFSEDEKIASYWGELNEPEDSFERDTLNDDKQNQGKLNLSSVLNDVVLTHKENSLNQDTIRDEGSERVDIIPAQGMRDLHHPAGELPAIDYDSYPSIPSKDSEEEDTLAEENSRLVIDESEEYDLIPTNWWSLHKSALWIVGISLAIIFLAIGFYFYRQNKVSQILMDARKISISGSYLEIKDVLTRLEKVKFDTKNSAEVKAMIARLSARMAFDFSDETMSKVASLIVEAKRAGAQRYEISSADNAIAEAYLELTIQPLDVVIERLKQKVDQYQSPEFKILYAIAATRKNKYELANRLLHSLHPSFRVELLIAHLNWLRGGDEEAIKVLRELLKEHSTGLEFHRVSLEMAKIDAWQGRGDLTLFNQLAAIALNKNLSPADRSWAYLLQAVIARRLGKVKIAQSALAKAVKQRPLSDPSFHALSAREMLNANQFEKSRKELDQALLLAPKNVRYQEVLASLDLHADHPERVVQSTLERSTMGILLLAKAALARGEILRAKEFLVRLDVRHLSKSLSLKRNILKAELFIAQKEPYRALRLLGNLRKTNSVELTRAKAALAAKEYDSVDQHLKHALSLEERNARAYGLLAKLYIAKRQPAKAIDALKKALTINSQRYLFRLELAELYRRLGLYQKAEKEYQTMLKDRPTNSLLHEGLAKVYVELNRENAEKAIKNLRSRMLKDSADLMQIRLLMIRKKWERANVLLQGLPLRLRNDLRVKLWSAEIYAELKRTKKAKAIYKFLIEDGRFLPESELGLALIAYRKEKKTQALDSIKNAIEGFRSKGIYSLLQYRNAIVIGLKLANDLGRKKLSSSLRAKSLSYLPYSLTDIHVVALCKRYPKELLCKPRALK